MTTVKCNELSKSRWIIEHHKNQKRLFDRHVIDGQVIELGCLDCKTMNLKKSKYVFEVKGKQYEYYCKDCGQPVHPTYIAKCLLKT